MTVSMALVRQLTRSINASSLITFFTVLNMLVKPMKAGVTATVLMDCCHSGTVLDLPYKFGSEDRHPMREEGFNMDVVKQAVRKKPLSEKEFREGKQQRQKERNEKQKAEERRAQRKEEKRDCGPKLAPNGQPVLPSRPAAVKPNHPGKPPQRKVVDKPPPKKTTPNEVPDKEEQAPSPRRRFGFGFNRSKA